MRLAGEEEGGEYCTGHGGVPLGRKIPTVEFVEVGSTWTISLAVLTVLIERHKHDLLLSVTCCILLLH